MRSEAPRDADRPIGELLREIGSEISTLIRHEIALAKVELGAKARQAATSGGLFGAGALLALGAFGAFTTFLIALLALAVDVWGAALIVTFIYGVAAGMLALIGQRKLPNAARSRTSTTALSSLLRHVNDSLPAPTPGAKGDAKVPQRRQGTDSIDVIGVFSQAFE